MIDFIFEDTYKIRVFHTLRISKNMLYKEQDNTVVHNRASILESLSVFA